MSPSSSSTPPADRFAVHEDSPVLPEDLREPLVRYARRRIRRAGELAPPSNVACDPLADSVRTCSTLGLDDSRRSTSSAVALVGHADVDLGECLGYGSFSSCYAVKAVRGLDDSYRSTHEDRDQDGFDESRRSTATSSVASADSVVVKVLRGKVMDTPKMFAACAGDLVKEGRFLASLNHANVVAVRAASSEDGVSAYGAVGRHDAYFLVLDRLEETLAGRIVGWKTEESIRTALGGRRRGSLDILGRRGRAARRAHKAESLADKRRALLELAEAISYVHSRGMVHRDVKPDNIGFDREGTLKLFDFDVARVLPTAAAEEAQVEDDEDGVPPPPPLADPYGEVHKMTKRVGSPRYMAPECALGHRYNARVDVYSYGLVAHEILTLEKPYDDVHSDDHDEAVFVEGVRPRVPRSWTPQLGSVIEGCWSHDPEERPTMEAAKSDLGVALDAYADSIGGPSSKTTNTAPSKSKSVGVERGGRPRLGKGAGSWSRRMARRVSAQ